jgi:hypothetical protein
MSNRKYNGVMTSSPQMPAIQKTIFANFMAPPDAHASAWIL